MKKLMMLSLATGMLLSACTEDPQKPIDLKNFDLSVTPGEDFYQYVCGGWMKNNPLKPEYSRFGAFDYLSELCEEQVKNLITELGETEQPAGSVARKIGDLYNLGIDSIRLNKEGYTPIIGDMEMIASSSIDSFPALIANLHLNGIPSFFSAYVGADMKNSDMNLLSISQGGIALGDRDYYLADDSTNISIREAYRRYITKLFELVGQSKEATTDVVNSILKIETNLAKISFSKEDLRNPYLNYNNMTYADFLKKHKNFNWNMYFNTLGIKTLQNIDVSQMPFFSEFDKYYATLSEKEIKNYLIYMLLNNAASFLSDDFSNAKFEFFGRTLSGRQEQRARWKRSLSITDIVMSEAIGEIYVAKYFPQESKERMLKLVKNLQKALHQHIGNLEWMSEPTKLKAQEKLSAFTIKIGYPDKWRDYSSLEITTDKSYWDNLKVASKFDMEYMLSNVDKPVDKSRWYMSPQTVNAYYNPTTNEICFPAGILQPPFFYSEADDAVNYGAIGVVIGHEMTHGFDDMGRQFDKKGNLNNWWTDDDANKFNALADILVEQFNNIIVIDSVHANGRFTLGENIADQGGLRVAYTAFQNATIDELQEPIDGFTPEQRFYLAYASLWANNIRDEEILRLTRIDSHSLGKWRVNAALKNIDTFYEAFDITPNQPMYLAPEKRVTIW